MERGFWPTARDEWKLKCVPIVDWEVVIDLFVHRRRSGSTINFLLGGGLPWLHEVSAPIRDTAGLTSVTSTQTLACCSKASVACSPSC